MGERTEGVGMEGMGEGVMVAQRTNQLKNRTKPTTQKTRNLALRRTVSPYFFVFIFIPLSREQAPAAEVNIYVLQVLDRVTC